MAASKIAAPMVDRPIENEERKNQEERERPPQKQKHGPPTGSLILMSPCGVTVTANKLANLPIREPFCTHFLPIRTVQDSQDLIDRQISDL